MSKLAKSYYEKRGKRFNLPTAPILDGDIRTIVPVDRKKAYGSDRDLKAVGEQLGTFLKRTEPFIVAGLRSHTVRKMDRWPTPAPIHLPKQDGRTLAGNREFPGKILPAMFKPYPQYSNGIYLEALAREEVPQALLDRAASEYETGNRLARDPRMEDSQVYFLLRGEVMHTPDHEPRSVAEFLMGSLVLRQDQPALTFMKSGLMRADMTHFGIDC